MTVSSDLYNNEGVPKPVSNARYYTKVPERFQTPVVKPPVVTPPVEQRTTFAPSAPRKTAGRKRRGRKGRKTHRRHRK